MRRFHCYIRRVSGGTQAIRFIPVFNISVFLIANVELFGIILYNIDINDI